MASFENQMQRDICQDTVFCESVEDFILPDYMPEIARVLRISTQINPERCYLGGDATEFSGRLCYRLLYADSEGKVTEAPLEGRYRYRIPHGDAAVHTAYTSEKIDSTGARPTAPRKLNIRTRIAAHPHLLYTEGVGTPILSLVGEADSETLYKEHSVLDRQAIFSDPIPCATDITVEGCSPDELQIISCEAAFLPDSVFAHEGYVSVQGKMLCTLLMQKAGGQPHLRECTLPLNEDITAEGCSEGDAITLEAFCTPPAITMENAGEDTLLHFDGECSLSIVLYRHRKLSLLTDFYVLGATHNIRRKETNLAQLVGTYTGNVTARADIPLPEGFSTDNRTAVPYFSVKDSTATLAADRVLVEGSLALTLLAFGCENTDKTELSFPFRAELPLGAACSPSDTLFYTVTPISGSALCNGGSVHVSTELYLTACATRNEIVSLPTEAIKTADISKQDDLQIKLYYPTEEDSLWSVGKRYALPINGLQKQNGIPEEEDTVLDDKSSLDGYAYLIVDGL